MTPCLASKSKNHHGSDSEKTIRPGSVLDQTGGRRRQIRTGFRREQVQAASNALAEYIGRRHTPIAGGNDPAELAIADIITFTKKSSCGQNPISICETALREAMG